MTSAAPEPTDEQREAAWRALFPNHPPNTRYAASVHQIADVESVARALAAAVAAEREKYLRVAEELEQHAAGAGLWEPDDATAYRDAARRIGEVPR